MLIGFDGRLANDKHRVGGGQYCSELLKAMAPLLGEDRLIVYIDEEPKSFFPLKPSSNVDIKILGKAKFWTNTLLAKALKKDHPDVFFSPSLQVPWFVNIPKCSTIYDIAYYDFPSEFTWKFRVKAKFQLYMAVKTTQIFIAISESTQKRVLSIYPELESRIYTVLLGVDRNIKRTPQERQIEIRKKYHLEFPFFLYLGRIQPRKNIIRMIEAFELFLDTNTNSPLHLVIVGSLGWLYEPILSKMQNSKYAERIHYLGYVEDEDEKIALISSAEALILVSLWEGFGLPIVEAMKCETPVITSNCSSLIEVVGDAGLLVNPYNVLDIKNAMEKISLSPELRQEIIIKGNERVALFTWENTASQILGLLRKKFSK
ncbi:MAG: glycosyltransferase family 4 protein [Candidatus Hydrogenedentes bacterium]|nr:glycosyltransferase family 4 protein [Candidatus Hydrogenedentota bacterium]